MAEALTTFEEFESNARGRKTSLVSQRLYFDTETPVGIYLKLRDASPNSFLFESVEGGRALGRYSIVGIDPVAIVSIQDGTASATALRDEGKVFEGLCGPDKQPMEVLRSIVDAVSSDALPEQPRFTGGWVGYFGYDSVRFIEDIPLPSRSEGDPPEVMLGLFMDVVVIDNVSRTVTLLSNALIHKRDAATMRRQYDDACKRIGRIKEFLTVSLVDHENRAQPGSLLDPGTSRSEFVRWVEKGKEYIVAGDIFQVVLSRYQTIRLDVDPLFVYRALRRINPSPYMYILSLGGLSVIGSSPEMLVRVEGRTVQTRPIAGTRPRGSDEAKDAAVEADLRSDTKEKAEHLMLVDLARNDLGKMCVPGSVRVSDFMSIEKYSHVMHLCSTVSGVLRSGSSPIDALYACFPAGTLSGAPKVRAMQIISELEPGRRGVYGGAIGYVDFSGNLDTCIAIRTIVSRDGAFRLQAGAGIVHDSVPDREFNETADKMGALVEAMRASGFSEGKA